MGEQHDKELKVLGLVVQQVVNGRHENVTKEVWGHIYDAILELIGTRAAPQAVDLPPWNELSARNLAGETLTPLERFIVDNEPAGQKEAARFREQLRALLNAVQENAHE